MPKPSILTDSERFFHEQIPLSAAMGVGVESFDGSQLVLTAPLEPNHNHLGTAFGGSLGAIAMLAGYGFLWLRLEDRSAHIVIRRSSIEFHRPVRKSLRAICNGPDDEVMSGFMSQFLTRGKARVTLQVRVVEDGETCVEFEGEFVALK